MEENTATMQTLVIAHAAFGHNHFFKNNYLFQQWTDADGILDYLEFAKGYIAACEEKHGEAAVERGARRGARADEPRRPPLPRARASPTCAREEKRERERREHDEHLQRSLAHRAEQAERAAPASTDEEQRRRALLQLPQENLLYFLEKTAPRLQPWQREILRIVRHIAQYFYPQRQTKVMNEGCATFVHHRIMNRLHEKGRIDDGAMLEFLHSPHQRRDAAGLRRPALSGINPYALGFAMMEDIERICREPTEEDRDWFPDIAGSGDPMPVLREAWANYRDESFMLQFLSPRLIRKMRLFQLADDAAEHDAAGRRDPRRARLPAGPPRAGAAVRRRPGPIPTSRSSTWTSPATGGWCWSTAPCRPAAGGAARRGRCCATSPTSGATTCCCARWTRPAARCCASTRSRRPALERRAAGQTAALPRYPAIARCMPMAGFGPGSSISIARVDMSPPRSRLTFTLPGSIAT